MKFSHDEKLRAMQKATEDHNTNVSVTRWGLVLFGVLLLIGLIIT